MLENLPASALAPAAALAAPAAATDAAAPAAALAASTFLLPPPALAEDAIRRLACSAKEAAADTALFCIDASVTDAALAACTVCSLLTSLEKSSFQLISWILLKRSSTFWRDARTMTSSWQTMDLRCDSDATQPFSSRQGGVAKATHSMPGVLPP